MPRIAWVDDADADGELAAIFDEARAEFQGRVPEIMRAMSVRPDLLRAFYDMSRMHFSAGALSYPQHELIASYVSALNRCHF